MKGQPRTEADQKDFFNACHERFERARMTSGECSRLYRIGGTAVRLLFAGERLVPYITAAIEHLRMPEGDAHDVTFCIWDSQSTHTKMVPRPFKLECFNNRGDIWGFTSRRIKTAFLHGDECSLNLMDLEARTGIYWVETTDGFPYWVQASPLRTLFHWWMEANGRQLLHAASIGTEDGAVLITGKGGVGKSTTALSCLQAGLSYVADDFLIARLSPEPMVYSLYNTGKLNSGHAMNFPELMRFVNNTDKLDKEKAVMYLYPGLKERISLEAPLRAIMTPRIMDRSETRTSPISRRTIECALSFTAMSMLPCAGSYTSRFVSKLAAGLPCFTLELGRDLSKIPAAIADFLAAPPSNGDSNETSAHLLRAAAGSRPPVSVIIPVFNGERFIEEAVQSVMAQKYPALEIIVVDDGSTDRTGMIVREKLPGDIRYFRQENKGPAAARNLGIMNATGEFIVFLDVDDKWPEGNLNVMVDKMIEEPGMQVITGYAQLMQKDASGGYEHIGDPKESFKHFIGAAIYRKEAFEKVGLFDPSLRFGEDTDWYMRANEAGTSMKRLEEITLFVRRHGGNMTGGKNFVELGNLRVAKKCLERRRAQAKQLHEPDRKEGQRTN